MPSNTAVNLPNINAFSNNVVALDAQGAIATITAGSTGNVDLMLADDVLITGIQLIIHGGIIGDSVNLQVVDINNVLGFGANTVLKQFATNWYVTGVDGESALVEAAYSSKIFAGLCLRVIYTSTGSNDVTVACNYILHKVLY